MKRIIHIISIVLLAQLAMAKSYIDNPSVPGGSATRPPSAGQSGLYRTPDPIDRSGNLLVTGNVRAGRSFQGAVPYGAESDFRAPLGSGSLDSFLRDSAGSESYGVRYRGGSIVNNQPFYSPTGTTTSTKYGQSGPVIFGPAETQRDLSQGKTPLLQSFRIYPEQQGLDQQPLYYQSEKELKTLDRPLTPTSEELEQSLARDLQRIRQENEEKQKELQQDSPDKEQLEELTTQLDKLQEKTENLKQDLAIDTQPKRQGLDEKTGEQADELLERQEQTLPPKDIANTDIYAMMQEQVNELEQKYAEPEADEQPEEESTDIEVYRTRISREEAAELQQEEKLSRAELALDAQAILGEHKTFASYSKSKFNDYMKAAEKLMQEGKYYRAANSYEVASVYKPVDPLPVAGRAHALFAAGEYVSSSLFLARTIEMFPEYVRFKVDLPTMIGSKDVVEERIEDIRKWYKDTKNPDMLFLLAYVYHQMDRPDRAKAVIDQAAKDMPDSMPVKALKAVIDKSTEY